MHETSSPLSSELRGATSQRQRRRVRGRVLVASLLVIATLTTTIYTALSFYITVQLVKIAPRALDGTPAKFGLAYRDISFFSRGDHVRLRGWLIPGVQADGSLTLQRTIIMVHGSLGTRTDQTVGILTLSAKLARRGFAVLTFDLRGHGESAAAPISYGYFEQRDVLGAVDLLRTGPEAYPALGRPRAIGGWGVSMGASTLILAAAQEPAIAATVSDSAYADVIPLFQREIPKMSHLPAGFTPGVLFAARILYGVDLSSNRPIDVIARLAPRPILLIHGEQDTNVPFSDMQQLAASAQSGSGAQVSTWAVPNANHAQAFLKQGNAYVQRIVDFYTRAL